MVELLPHEALSPFLWTGGVLGPHAVSLPQHVDVGVGGHLAQRVRHRLRAFDMQVAPPEHGLDALELREAAVAPQDLAELGVHAPFDPVVGGGHRPLCAQRRVEVREQRPRIDEPDEPRPRLAQPAVGVGHAAFNQAFLLEEVGPELAPLHEALDPPVGLLERLHMQQLPGQRVELDARLQLGPRRRMPLDLAERVEHASLDPRPRPFGRDRRGEAAAAVGDHHVGRGDAREQRAPRGGRLGAREVPRQHVLVAAGYEHHAVARDPDAVDVDDAEDLVHHLRHRPYRPEEGGPPPEGSAAPRHIGLRPAREQPADKGRELPGRHVVGMLGAGAARPAAPSLGARRGPPVPLHGPSAGRAFHIIHGILPESVTFYREFPHATWENVNNRTHFLSEWESRFG